MKNNINKLCGINAILCIIMSFIPMIRDPAYIFNIELEYAGGIVFDFRRATSGYYDSESIWKILLFIYIIALILLLIWAIFSLSHPDKTKKIGIIASIVNLVISFFMIYVSFVFRNLILVTILMAFFTISAVVLAFIQYKSQKIV